MDLNQQQQNQQYQQQEKLQNLQNQQMQNQQNLQKTRLIGSAAMGYGQMNQQVAQTPKPQANRTGNMPNLNMEIGRIAGNQGYNQNQMLDSQTEIERFNRLRQTLKNKNQ